MRPKEEMLKESDPQTFGGVNAILLLEAVLDIRDIMLDISKTRGKK